MAGYTVRSLAELSAAVRSAFVQAVQGTAARLTPNVWRVEAKVLALLGFEMESRRAWLVRQVFASTADDAWLVRHGFELGLTPFPALPALGSVTAGATDGLAVPAGLQYARADGVTLTVLAGAAGVGTSVGLTIEADAAGEIGNTDPGTVLTLVDVADAPAGLALTATVGPAGLGGGADAEGIEAFRARVLARKRRLPQGGSAVDYETWVREALGASVADVYVDSFVNDARSVWVAFTVTDQPNGIPSGAQLAVTQAYLDDPIRRPVTARVFAIALTPVPVPVLIGGLSPDTPDIRAAIAAEVAAVFADRAQPGRPSAPFSLSRSWIEEAISRATGEDRHRLVAPAADPTFAAGLLPVYAAPTYTD